ncbi:putative uncharacterized protein [Parachlamydia acanthamoebae UV-7]|jgi:cobalt-zinc-cadmium efflux system outer membrane protein|uniref:Cobalt-zinc-cadmium resistance protein CzcC n=2 Tax=Parachlamydia acanthamoebae TaxID=83552 RepID=F8L2F6_PARAV|nr:TolC family protein [Parachlamydia acanthamoebae]CCB87469.1 putative uncharacterized protein [Parachlamydia acanthamoebae UV-7]
MQKSLIILILFLSFFATTLAVSQEKVLTLEEGIQRVLACSPQLKMSEAEAEEKKGLHVQAGFYPNPILSYSVENVFGNRNWHGWNAAESRYEYAQLIETGGKRELRSKTTDYLFRAACLGVEVAKLQLLNRFTRAFIDLVAAQEQLRIVKEQNKIAKEVLYVVSAKVEAGKVSIIQKHKAEISVANADILLEKVRVNFETAREQVSQFWGETVPDFESVGFNFYFIQAPQSLDAYLAYLHDHPEWIQAQLEQSASLQSVYLEKSLAIPDVTLSVGYKTIRDTHNQGMILGASLPIPVFNRNQGNIEKSRANLRKLEDSFMALQVLLENKSAAIHREFMRSYHESKRLKEGILEAALQAFKLSEEGYREGKFEYLDMLDSQRTLFEIEDHYVQALKNYHSKQAELRYLSSQVD